MPDITELIEEGLSNPVNLEKVAQEALKNELGIKSKLRTNWKHKSQFEFFESKEKPTLLDEVIVPVEVQILNKIDAAGLFSIDERRTNVGFNKGPPKPPTPKKHKTPLLDAFNKIKRYGILKANKIARRTHTVVEAVRYELNKFELFPKKKISEQEKILAQNRILASQQRTIFIKERKLFTDAAIKLDAKYRMRCHHKETGEDNDITSEYRSNNINPKSINNTIHSPRYDEYFSQDAIDVQKNNAKQYVAGYLSQYRGKDKIFPLNSHPNTLKVITQHIHTIEKPDYPEKLLLSNLTTEDKRTKHVIIERKKRTANKYFKKKNIDFTRDRMKNEMESESDVCTFDQIHNPDYDYKTKNKLKRKPDYKEKMRYYRLTGNSPCKPERERGHKQNFEIGRDNAYMNTREERHLKNHHDRRYHEETNKEIVMTDHYLFDRKFIDAKGLVNYNKEYDDEYYKKNGNSFIDDNKENSFISNDGSKNSHIIMGDSRTLASNPTFINKLDNYNSSLEKESMEERTFRRSKSTSVSLHNDNNTVNAVRSIFKDMMSLPSKILYKVPLNRHRWKLKFDSYGRTKPKKNIMGKLGLISLKTKKEIAVLHDERRQEIKMNKELLKFKKENNLQ